MFKTLLLKEIQDSLHNLSFLVVTLICLFFIPFGLYVAANDYEQRLNEFNEARRLYQERSQGKINYGFSAEGYRPPSDRSVFAFGLEYSLPTKIVTSDDGLYRLMDETGIRNPQSELFGKLDYLYTVGFILSLLALIFTFNSISGEKEMGTLKFTLANSVPRWKVILAKITGRYIIFLVPFIVSCLIGLLLLALSGTIAVFTQGFLVTCCVIEIVSLLFIFTMFTLGMVLSTLAKQSITSIMFSLFIWIVLVTGVPKISPMVAQVIKPVKSQQVVNIEKQLIRESINDDLKTERSDLFEAIMREIGITDYTDILGIDNPPPAMTDAYAKYDEEVVILEKGYQERINNTLENIDRNYHNDQNNQSGIAVILSRISPVSCFTYIISELSGTGLIAAENLPMNARRFQEKVEKDIYSKQIYKIYGGHDWPRSSFKGFEEDA